MSFALYMDTNRGFRSPPVAPDAAVQRESDGADRDDQTYLKARSAELRVQHALRVLEEAELRGASIRDLDTLEAAYLSELSMFERARAAWHASPTSHASAVNVSPPTPEAH